jgi:uncharacterized delta-60 repeat protein
MQRSLVILLSGRSTLPFSLSLLLIVCFTCAARAQSALDGFDPNANGSINTIVLQPDGKILIGGAFTTLSPNGGSAVTRNRIARLNADGTLDSAFNPNANGTVNAIALQADGKILVGGAFSGANSIGGQPRNRIARIEPVTGSADAFDPNANNTVNAISLQADGKIVVGGVFSGTNSIGGQTRNRVARLDPMTGLADSFDPNANIDVNVITLQPDGKILIGGLFTTLSPNSGASIPRNRIARLDPATAAVDSFDPNANNQVLSIALQVDGKILVGGLFNVFSGSPTIGGQTRNFIARLDPVTGLADSFNPNSGGRVNTIAPQADGKILVGGFFLGSIGGASRGSIARLDQTTGMADAYNPNSNDAVNTLVVQESGKALVGGMFTALAPNGGATVTRNHLARLETDGRLDQTLNLDLGGPAVGTAVYTTAVQADGKIIIGGVFSSVLGVARNNIARLNSDGTLDTSFDPNANGTVFTIIVQVTGKLMVGGSFTSIGGQSRNRIARLDTSTGAADSFNPNASSTVFAIAVQPDGKMLVGGAFITIGGAARSAVARLDTSGFADSWDPSASGVVRSLAIQADGKILIGGDFTSIGGQPRNHIARLDPATGSADAFNPDASDIVFALQPQLDGMILVGGRFTLISGQTRNNIARLDPDTGSADSFNTGASGDVGTIVFQGNNRILVGGSFTGIGPYLSINDYSGASLGSYGADNVVTSVAVLPDGKFLVGGFFGNIGGQQRNGFARISNNVSVTQNLSVIQGFIAWNWNGGPGPQFARVTFEQSLDNVNYTPLGNGTWDGSNWRLSGITLPTDQNLYIRARGYSRSGYSSGSESITESVRNAFLHSLSSPTATPTNTPTDTPTPDPCSWSQAAPFPIPIVAEAAVTVGGNIYTFGGVSAQAYTANSYKFDGAFWTPIAPLPTLLSNASAVTDGTDIYIVGGINGSGVPQSSAYRYNVGSNSYVSLSPSPTATWNQAAVYLNGKIYKFTGTGFGGPTNALDIYNLSTNTWTSGAFYPSSLSFVSGFTQNGFVYGGGGQTSGGVGTTNTYRYDPVANAWNDVSIADLTSTKFDAATTVFNGMPMLVGGYGNGNMPSDITVRLVAWNSSTNTWSNYSNLPSERAEMGAAVLNGSLYVIGGRSMAQSGYMGTVENQKLTCVTPSPTPTNTPTATVTTTPTNTPTATPTSSGTPSISGTITYFNAIGAPTPRFVSNVTLTAEGSPTIFATTDFPNGNYTLTGFGQGSYTVTPSKAGGVNGAISSFDAGKIALHVAGPPNPQLTANQLVVADVSGNGSVTSFDAGMIAKFVAGPPYAAPGIGATGTWRFMPASRNYASVTGGIGGEDYSALLMGEVSGNWMNTGARPVTDGQPVAVNVGRTEDYAGETEIADVSVRSPVGSTGPVKNIAVRVPDLTAKADGEVLVPITVESVANKGIISYEFDLRYDPSVIEPQVRPVDLRDTESSGLSFVVNATEPGLLRVVLYGAYQIERDGVLLNLRFTAVGKPGSVSPLMFDRMMFNEGEPRVTTSDGQVGLF